MATVDVQMELRYGQDPLSTLYALMQRGILKVVMARDIAPATLIDV